MQSEPKTTLTAIENNTVKSPQEDPQIMEEIVVEELSIDGICGVY